MYFLNQYFRHIFLDTVRIEKKKNSVDNLCGLNYDLLIAYSLWYVPCMCGMFVQAINNSNKNTYNSFKIDIFVREEKFIFFLSFLLAFAAKWNVIQ